MMQRRDIAGTRLGGLEAELLWAAGPGAARAP